MALNEVIRRTEPGTVTTDVVMAVADVSGTDVHELELLHDVINPDALERLFVDPIDGSQRGNGHVFFTMAGCGVAVYSDGKIVVTSIDDGRDQ